MCLAKSVRLMGKLNLFNEIVMGSKKHYTKVHPTTSFSLNIEVCIVYVLKIRKSVDGYTVTS